jgi:hypothetical protein
LENKKRFHTAWTHNGIPETRHGPDDRWHRVG